MTISYEAQYAGPGYGWRVAKLVARGGTITETTHERPFTTREQAETRAAELTRLSCQQCGTLMNPVEAILGAVCGKCCRANHRAVVGRC